MPDFTRLTTKLLCRGVQLSKPVDSLDPSKFAILRNCRSVQDGSIQCRPGVSALNAMAALDQLNVHSVRRLNDPLPGAANPFIRVTGAGTKLYAGVTPVAALVTGFSGNPLSLIPYRPPSSPESWMYVGDSSKMVKVNPDAAPTANMGGAPPQAPLTSALAAPALTVIDDFDVVGAWTNGGTAGALAAALRVNTTIVANGIIYDTGATGWACIAPTAFTGDLQAGMRLIINTGGGSAETVLVDSTQRASVLATTTIAAILYDVGNTGLCTVQMSIPNPLLQRNSMVRFAGGTAETVRVLSVTAGPDGLSSFRCSTVNTHAAAESLTGFVSFRAYCLNTHAAGETLTGSYVQSTIATGTGYFNLVSALNLSIVGARPIQETDIWHISIQLDNNASLTEARVEADFDGAVNDFTRNYFFFPIRPNDLVGAVAQTQTSLQAQQQALQRQSINREVLADLPLGLTPREQQALINAETAALEAEAAAQATPVPVTPESIPDPGSGQTTSSQTSLGTSQWTELVFRVADLVRVGADLSRGLKDVAALRLNFVVTAATVVRGDAWD